MGRAGRATISHYREEKGPNGAHQAPNRVSAARLGLRMGVGGLLGDRCPPPLARRGSQVLCLFSVSS